MSTHAKGITAAQNCARVHGVCRIFQDDNEPGLPSLCQRLNLRHPILASAQNDLVALGLGSVGVRACNPCTPAAALVSNAFAPPPHAESKDPRHARAPAHRPPGCARTEGKAPLQAAACGTGARGDSRSQAKKCCSFLTCRCPRSRPVGQGEGARQTQQLQANAFAAPIARPHLLRRLLRRRLLPQLMGAGGLKNAQIPNFPNFTNANLPNV